MHIQGRLGGSVGWASDFGSGQDLTVREFEPPHGLSAVIAEPALDPRSPPPLLALSLSKNRTFLNVYKVLLFNCIEQTPLCQIF